MDVSYVVRAYMSQKDIDTQTKQTIYAGTSPGQAFGIREQFSEFNEIEVDVWENGHIVFRHRYPLPEKRKTQ